VPQHTVEATQNKENLRQNEIYGDRYH